MKEIGELLSKQYVDQLIKAYPEQRLGKPDMTRKPSTCHRCITSDEHLFLAPSAEWICSKCYEKETGLEP